MEMLEMWVVTTAPEVHLYVETHQVVCCNRGLDFCTSVITQQSRGTVTFQNRYAWPTYLRTERKAGKAVALVWALIKFPNQTHLGFDSVCFHYLWL